MNYLDLVRDVHVLIRARLGTIDRIALGRVCRAERGPPITPTIDDLLDTVARCRPAPAKVRETLMLKLWFNVFWLEHRPTSIYCLTSAGFGHGLWQALNGGDFDFRAWVVARGCTVARDGPRSAILTSNAAHPRTVLPIPGTDRTLAEIADRGMGGGKQRPWL